MKKLLFSAYDLNIGGIEKALVTLVNKLDQKGYDITLVLEKKQGIFLEELSSNIKIIEYRPSETKNIFFRKIRNLLKRVLFILKYKNKFDFSACYATYSLPSSFTAKAASKNPALWVHTDYLSLFDGNKQEVKKFFKEKKYYKFKKIIFVSNNAKENFLKIFPETREKIIVINNLIDADKIKRQAEEEIEYKQENDFTTFINVGRHSEAEKKLTRLIEASQMLVEDKLNFKVLLVGDGPDNNKYRDLVKERGLENYIIFFGAKQNPYPYFKIADCVILTSEYEGYPVVFLESFILNKPIITTKVSDYELIEEKFGYVTEKDAKDIYKKMKMFIENGYKIKEKFNLEEYNKKTIKKLEEIF